MDGCCNTLAAGIGGPAAKVTGLAACPLPFGGVWHV